MTIVLDASFAVNWLLAENGSPLSELIIQVSENENGFEAPIIFWHEVASALRSLRLRQQIEVRVQQQMLRRLEALDLDVDQRSDIRSVIDVSDRFSLTIYDAAYLELALRSVGDLATTDAALVRAGFAAGVRVLTA